MSNELKVSKVKIFFNILVAMVPVVCLIYGAYFGFFGIFLRNKFTKTYEDITYINNAIKERISGVYKDFDTQYVSLSEVLPFDLEVNKQEQANGQPLIKNRFGGNMFFYEALNSEAERTLYYGLIKNPEEYRKVYNGVTSYIILLTGLNSYECRKLAMHDWGEQLDNYIGIEVASLDNNQIYNGLTKLKTSFISDAKNDALYYNAIKDNGYISNYPLSEKRAKEKCSCQSDTCTFAIKLR